MQRIQSITVAFESALVAQQVGCAAIDDRRHEDMPVGTLRIEGLRMAKQLEPEFLFDVVPVVRLEPGSPDHAPGGATTDRF